MTKTETKRLVIEHRRHKRHRRAPEYRAERAFFLMGYIQAMRDLEALGNRGTGDFAELLRLTGTVKEAAVVHQLRKL